MAHTHRERTLALAGVYQAASLVHQVATKGQCDGGGLETCINSVFKTDPPTTEAVYGSAICISDGLRALVNELSGTTKRHVETTRYVLGLLYLERKLAKRRDLLTALSAGVDRAADQLKHFPPTHENVLANLADTYSNTISTLSPRIIVHGEHQHLNNPDKANMIRALLLAGIRSAVLWSQCGGNRWSLLLSRRKFVNEAQAILRSVHPE